MEKADVGGNLKWLGGMRKVEDTRCGDDWDGHGELEYLIKAWKRVCKSLQNAEAVGAVTVEDAKTSVQRLQEETLGAWNCGISGSLDGREPTRNSKRDKIRW